ncbi:MAG: sulfur carrier protein ThiS [Desulfobacteraceae bacterium]|nr:sulfur carrier protein ThiS [Desulfobacteraceae bacterium]
MIIQLNGLTETVSDELNVTGLIKWAKEGDPDLMVEINGRYVFPKDYDLHMIKENDKVEFINPNLGG